MSPKQAGARLLVTLKTTQWASLVVQRSPANAGDTGSIPGLRRSQMWRSDEARASQLMSLCSRACKSQLRSPRAATAHVQCPGSVLPERSHCREKPKNPQPESRPHTPQPEKSPYTKESEDPPQPKMIKNRQTDRQTRLAVFVAFLASVQVSFLRGELLFTQNHSVTTGQEHISSN